MITLIMLFTIVLAELLWPTPVHLLFWSALGFVGGIELGAWIRDKMMKT